MVLWDGEGGGEQTVWFCAGINAVVRVKAWEYDVGRMRRTKLVMWPEAWHQRQMGGMGVLLWPGSGRHRRMVLIEFVAWLTQGIQLVLQWGLRPGGVRIEGQHARGN